MTSAAPTVEEGLREEGLREEGLRERKRAATQATIERTAIFLALEHGYDNTTVEMICEASMVSQRTFFNYFGSKEGVILGAGSPMPSDAALESFIHGTGSSIVGDLVEAIATKLDDRELDPELFHSRRKVIQRTLELAHAEMARMMDAQDQLTRTVLARFREQGRSEADTPDLEDEARMVVTLSTGVMHHTMLKWRKSQFRADPRVLLKSSVALVQRITNSSSKQ